MPCRFCKEPVPPPVAVVVGREEAHPECADDWYRQIGRLIA